MFELIISLDFEAAHHIREYPGKCQRLHGHNWRVEVCVQGEQLDSLGMLIDFHDLKAEVRQVLMLLDHQYLNELSWFREVNPTAENLARFIYDELVIRERFQQGVAISYVQIWESAHSSVRYFSRDERTKVLR